MELIIIISKLNIITLSWSVTFHLSDKLYLTPNVQSHVEYIVKSNKILATYKLENEISHTLDQYKHGDDIHEHRK